MRPLDAVAIRRGSGASQGLRLMLFKYMKARDLEAFQEAGVLQIGSLERYRRSGGAEARDPQEGIVHASGEGAEVDPEQARLYPQAPAGPAADDSSERAVARDAAGLELYTPNIHVFSTAAIYSEEEHQQWLHSESYGTCLRIVDEQAFFEAVTDAIRRQKDASVRYLGLTPVLYFGSNDAGRDSELLRLAPHVLKRARYTRQHEVRALWVSERWPYPGGFTVEVPDARHYAWVHAVLAVQEPR